MNELERIKAAYDVELFPSASGQLSQSDQAAIVREQARLAREVMDYRREQSANNFARMVCGIGAAFIGGFVLMIGLAILASALRPAPPPPPPAKNPNCLIFCGGG